MQDPIKTSIFSFFCCDCQSITIIIVLFFQTFYGELRQLLRFVKECYGGVFWKVALSGLLDSVFKETKDQTDSSKTPEQELVAKGVTGKVQRKGTKVTKVDRSITYKTKRKFLHKFSRVTTESSDGNTSLSRLPSVVDSPSLEMTLSPRSKRKVRVCNLLFH